MTDGSHEKKATTSDDIRDVHVMPVDDLYEHVSRRACWCHPHITQEDGCGALVIHHAADMREHTVH